VNRLLQLRYERGLTQQQVADGSGVSERTLVRLERDAQRPSARIAKRLADYFGVEVTDVVPAEPRAAA
jgi:transcriptional regulator with XRE-family HTH domain